MKQSIYKNSDAQKNLLELYDKKLSVCNIQYEERYVDTFAGKTHVIITGGDEKPPVVLLHGINAGAPLALEAIRGITEKYRIYAIDTVGQVGKSSETRLDVKGDAYARWLAETMDQLELFRAAFIGVSYGAFLLQKLMTYFPERIAKGIFIVPGGFGNGPFFRSLTQLTIPLIRFMISKKERDLLKFMDAFFVTKDEHSVEMQKNILLGVKVDFRRPTILKKEDVKMLKAPVYTMVADDDVFFPGEITIERCQSLFYDFRESYVLKGGKHIPDQDRYQEIEDKVDEWLSEK